MSVAEIVDLFKLRETLELMAVEGAMTTITSNQLRDMEMALKKSERLLAAGKLADFSATLRSFHMIIAEATGNSLLEQILRMINDRVRLVAAMQFSRQADRPSEVIKENERILKALIKRDKVAAREAVLIHLRNARKIFAFAED
jgi:DNA-binding GntR family transcriptional regulator